LEELGYQLLAISPDAPAEMSDTIQKKKLTFELLSDPGLALARDMGLAFQQPGREPLPVPAVYIVGADGGIRFQHVDPNFRVRLDNKVILTAAKTLR
jgi:peroxiredoxin